MLHGAAKKINTNKFEKKKSVIRVETPVQFLGWEALLEKG